MLWTSVPFRAKLLDTASRVIRSKITVYDTKMAVPSKGIPFQMYDDQTWTNRILPSNTGDGYCVMPNLSLGWSYSAPFWMNVNEFSVDTENCWFNAEESSSSFGIYIFGEGVTVDAWIGGSGFNISNATLTHSPSVYASYGSISVSAGNWSRFRFRFRGQAGLRNAGVSAMYTYNYTGDLQADKGSLRVFNAGVISQTNAWAESADVTHHDNITGNRVKNEPTTYLFELPYGDATNGYLKDGNNFYTNGTARLQEGMLIEIYAGYDLDATPQQSQTEGVTDGNTEYMPRFTGYIGGFEIDRGGNKLKVNCIDFFGIAESSFCINYPDAPSYWGAGYFEDSVAREDNSVEPFGLIAPVAYDRWNVVSAIKDLFIKAGLPASRFYGMEQGRTSGDDLSDTIPSVYDGGFNLEYARYYGTDRAEEYVNTFDLGTTVHQAIMKLTDTYGYFIDFKPNGDLRFHPQDNATADTGGGNESRLSEQYQSLTGNAGRETSTEHLGGGYMLLPDTAESSITFNNPTGASGGPTTGIPATGFSIIFERNTDCGANDNNNQYWSGTSSVRIEIQVNGGEIIRTYNYNLYFDVIWRYDDGVSPLVGSNPCLIELDRNLLYDNYNVIVTNIGGNYNIRVDELWVFHTNASTPTKLLQTYRIVDQVASLSSVDFERDIKDTRNDVLVVGQRKGIWVAGGGTEAGLDDPDFENNNNQYTNYNFRSMDVESIYNPNALNYTGRHLMTYIQEPNITTDNRAKWLSYSILANYKDFDKRVNMSVVGDPEITIGDPITMLDRLEEDATDLVWVNGIRETINKTSWDIGLEVIGKQPFPSYDEAPDYDIEEDWDGRYFSDFTIGDMWGDNRDGTQKATVSGGYSWATSSLTLVGDLTSWDSSGTVVVYQNGNEDFHDNYAKYGVVSYGNINGQILENLTWRFTPAQGSFNNAANIMDGWKCENVYNPYEEADYGNFFTVSFRCLVEGNLSVGVKSMESGIFNYIAGLSSGGGLDDDLLPKEQRVSPGDVVEFIWGGVDETGITHEHTGDDNEVGAGFFTEDGKYQIVLGYTREGTEIPQMIYSSKFSDENGVEQRHSIGIGKSGPDNHQISYTYDSNLEQMNPVPGGSAQYTQGGSGRRDSTSLLDYSNINVVYISGVDENVTLTLRSHYLNTNRKYFITYWVKGHILTTGSSTGGLGTPGQFQVHSLPVDLVGGDGKQLNDGKATTFSNSDGYEILFNPIWPRFGSFSFDADFDSYETDWNANPLGLGKDYPGARGFYLRLILDIRDASGKRVYLSYINNTQDRRPLSNEPLYSALHNVYSDHNWNTIVEWYQVPTKIDQDNTYNGNFRVASNAFYSLPFFEARTRVPLSYVIKD